MKAAAFLIVVGFAAMAAAQPPARVPIITGNGVVNVLIEVDGTVKLWGNPAGMDPSPPFGNGVRPSEQPEVKVPSPLLPGVRDIVDAVVGTEHVLLLKRDGTVLAWGYNGDCQLGNGTDKRSLVPIPVPGLKNVAQIAGGGDGSAARLTDGTVVMWGGVGTKDCIPQPTRVAGLSDVARIAFDGVSGFAIKTDGTLWSWGDNRDGQLCDGTKVTRDVPAQVKGIANAVDVAVDGNSIIVLEDGTVRMCGNGRDGMLAESAGGAHLAPSPVRGISNAKSARTVSGTTFVQLADGTLRGWGFGWYGALGDGHGDQTSAMPKAPTGLGPVVAHYMSHNTSYAIKADGTVMQWGGLLAPPGSKTQFILTPSVAPFTVKMSP